MIAKKRIGKVICRHSFMRTTKYDSTGFSPFYLMFGRHPRMPIDITMGIELEERESSSASEYVEELREKLEWAYNVATKESRSASHGQKGR